MVADLDGVVSFYKIGYQLAFAGGLDFARELASGGTSVFLDMKLLDIDNTVAKGVENIAKMGMSMLTLHAYPKAMRAAVDAARGSDLCLLGVTVLTSMDEQDLIDAGYEHDPHTLVLRRAEQALAAGMGGIVCSADEAVGGSPDRRAATGGRHARHPARRRGSWRPEARRDAGRRDPQRRQPSCRGAAHRAGEGQARRRARNPGRDEDGLTRDNREAGMPKGYWIARVDVRDAEGYKDYVAAAEARLRQVRRDIPGARRRVRRPRKASAGRATSSSSSPSLQAAHDCYHSPEYQAAKAIRLKVAEGEIVLVEGL